MKLAHRRQFLHLAVGAAALPAISRIARAQAYPTRPVRVIIPFTPGGPTDIFGRLMAQKLSERLRTQFYVENVGGAGGNIGTVRAAKANPDGSTILIVSSSYVVNPALFENIPYDPIKDFDPVTCAVTTPMVLAVHPSLPVNTLQELFTLAKANPDKYSYASGGVGSPGHLAGAQLRLSLGVDFVHVPFKSAGDAITSTIGGHTLISIVAAAPTEPQIKEGRLRGLAVLGAARLSTLPKVPTMAEAGYPNILGENWFGVVVPTGTPKAIIALLNQEIIRILMLPDFTERIGALGFGVVGSTPEEFGKQIDVETEKWAKVIKAANIKPDQN